MTKKRTKAHKTHTTHKAHTTHEASEKKESHVSDKVSTSPITNNLAMIAVVFLVVGLLVGALVSYGAFMMNAPAEPVTTEGGAIIVATNPVDTEALKLRVQEYVNTNMLPSEVTLEILDVNQEEDGIFEFSYTISQDGEVAEEGKLYSSNTRLLLVQKGLTMLNLEEVVKATNGEFAQQEVVDAELYIWGYCPAGASTLDAYAEAAAYLKNVANVKVVLFHAGHGEFELQQNKIQAAIQQLEPEKYWDYAKDFYDEVYPICSQSGTVECDLEESTKLMEKVGINANAVMALVESDGDALVAVDRQKAIDLGISASPTLVMNGIVLSSFSRTAEGIKGEICNGFLEAPELCQTALSNVQTAGSGTC